MSLQRLVVLLLVGLLFMALLVGGCGMQSKSVTTSNEYPVKPITMIVPYAAGGSADMMARAMEKAAVKHFGQPLIIMNKPGGAATIGLNELAGSKPDGYTIGYVANGVVLQPLYGQTRYHYPTALEPIAQVLEMPVVLAVRSDQQWDSVDDLIHYAKENPGELKFGHSGLGTGIHLVGELFAKQAGIDMAQVPFAGGEPEGLAALLGGHIQLMFSTPPNIKEYVKSGKVKVLAIAREQRLQDPVFSNVPTFKEKGYNPQLGLWFGIGVPKGLPTDVKSRLAEGLKNMMADPEFVKRMDDLGMTVDYLGPQEFSKKWADEGERLGKFVKETGIAERIAAQKK